MSQGQSKCKLCLETKDQGLSIEFDTTNIICRECIESFEENDDFSQIMIKIQDYDRLECWHHTSCFNDSNSRYHRTPSINNNKYKNKNTCQKHKFCDDCYDRKFTLNIYLEKKIFSCKDCIKSLLFKCTKCGCEVNRKDKVFPLTCKHHYFCSECIINNNFERSGCIYCYKMHTYKTDKSLNRGNLHDYSFFSEIDHLLNKPLDLKVLVHGKHIKYIADLYLYKNNANCEECSIIINIFRKKLKIGSESKSKLEKYWSKLCKINPKLLSDNIYGFTSFPKRTFDYDSEHSTSVPNQSSNSVYNISNKEDTFAKDTSAGIDNIYNHHNSNPYLDPGMNSYNQTGYGTVSPAMNSYNQTGYGTVNPAINSYNQTGYGTVSPAMNSYNQAGYGAVDPQLYYPSNQGNYPYQNTNELNNIPFNTNAANNIPSNIYQGNFIQAGQNYNNPYYAHSSEQSLNYSRNGNQGLIQPSVPNTIYAQDNSLRPDFSGNQMHQPYGTVKTQETLSRPANELPRSQNESSCTFSSRVSNQTPNAFSSQLSNPAQLNYNKHGTQNARITAQSYSNPDRNISSAQSTRNPNNMNIGSDPRISGLSNLNNNQPNLIIPSIPGNSPMIQPAQLVGNTCLPNNFQNGRNFSNFSYLNQTRQTNPNISAIKFDLGPQNLYTRQENPLDFKGPVKAIGLNIAPAPAPEPKPQVKEIEPEIKEFTCTYENVMNGYGTVNSRKYLKKCSVHGDSLLFLKCNHQVCVKGIEQILEKKFKKFCSLMYEKTVDELNKFSFNVGCTSGCFVTNLFAFETFSENMKVIWKSHQFNENLYNVLPYLFSGFDLKFKICHCGCGGVLIGEYGCLMWNGSN